MNGETTSADAPLPLDLRDRAAVGRALTLIERGGEAAQPLLAQLHATGRAIRVGITGAPGAGKSTLAMQLVRALRPSGTVAVIAVDPSSPFSGGAMLGDRVRMNDVAADAGVFIRNMAARGALGGLSAAVADGADVLEAAGYDYVLIETVGVGQSELDIAGIADTTLVLVTPESGDEVQTAKAGLLEVADVFVLNKDDRPDGNALWNALRRMVDARSRTARGAWTPPIVRTVATERKGIEAMHEALLTHREYIAKPEVAAEVRRAKARLRLRNAVREGLWNAWLSGPAFEKALEDAANRVLRGEVSPHRAARDLTERIARHGQRQD